MQIVIDIPESMYEGIKLHRVLDTTVEEILYQVENGTVLPEKHGKLIDVIEFLTILLENYDSYTDAEKKIFSAFCDTIKKTPTVLESKI